MKAEEITNASLEIKERFAKCEVNVSVKEIAEKLAQLVNQFYVPMQDARRTVTDMFRKKHNISADTFFATVGFQNQDPVKIGSLKDDNKWVTFAAKISLLWEPRHEKIQQVGVMGDETGTISFTTWLSSGAPVLEEGKCYLFKNVVTSEYNSKISIKINKNSVITEHTEDIVVSKNTVTVSGAMVDLQQGSGLIKRCPECNKALAKGACRDHGKVEGVYDLRIKAVIDNGTEPQDIVVNRELTEALTGVTLDAAKEMAIESLDIATVSDEIRRLLVGKYFEVTGTAIDKNLIASSIKIVEKDMNKEVSALLATMEA